MDAKQHLNEAYRLLAEGETQLEGAFDQVEAALRVEPTNVEALVLKGRMLDHVQHHVDAFLCLSRAVELDETNLDAVLDLAANCSYRERHDEAWEYYRRAGELLTELEQSDGEPAEEDWAALTVRRVNCLLDWAEAVETPAAQASELQEHAGSLIGEMRRRFPTNSRLAVLHGELLDRLGSGGGSTPAVIAEPEVAPSSAAETSSDESAMARLETIAAERCRDREPAHDWAHVLRVTANARLIGEAEGADLAVVVPAALLHELVNYPKNHPDSHRSGEVCADEAAKVLAAAGVAPALIEPIAECIRVHGFSRGIVPETLEAKVLQDADRLDAIGAIGIARVFATCADMKRPFYHPDDPFCEEREPDDQAWGVDHFFRKLLRIPDVLHTETAKAIAAERVAFLETYLEQLGREIAGF